MAWRKSDGICPEADITRSKLYKETIYPSGVDNSYVAVRAVRVVIPLL